MRRKPPALRNVGIDRDARALARFECEYPVELVHGCAPRFVAHYAFEGTELIYSDPPYLRRTRTSRRRYRYDYEEADPIEWLEPLKGVPCRVMVSGYPSALRAPRPGNDCRGRYETGRSPAPASSCRPVAARSGQGRLGGSGLFRCLG